MVAQRDEKRNQIIQQDRIAENPPSKGKKELRRFPKPLPKTLNWLFKNPLRAFSLLIFGTSLAFWLLIAPALGQLAGAATGSWRGVTQGIAAGAEAGKEAGLSAEDTIVTIGSKMTETGNLQVMLVDLKISDIYTQGPENNPQYAALLGLKGEGVFSVDLTQSETTYDAAKNQITITIPEPTFRPYLDDSTIEVLAEYKPRFGNGSTVNGYRGYLNSRDQISEKVQEEMLSMIEPAKASALEQVELLARSVCGSTASIQVKFIEGWV